MKTSDEHTTTQDENGRAGLPYHRRCQIIFDSRLPPTERFTLHAINHHLGTDGICWPSQTTLSRETGLARETVYRAVGRLADCGCLTMTRRGQKAGTIDYRINFEAVGSYHPTCDAESHVKRRPKRANMRRRVSQHETQSLLTCDAESHVHETQSLTANKNRPVEPFKNLPRNLTDHRFGTAKTISVSPESEAIAVAKKCRRLASILGVVDDCQVLWRIATLVVRGKIPDAVITAALAGFEAKQHEIAEPVAYFVACVRERCERAHLDFDALNFRLRKPEGMKKWPPTAPTTDNVRS